MLERTLEERAYACVQRMAKFEEADHLAELGPQRVEVRRELERRHQVLERGREARLREQRLGALGERECRSVVSPARSGRGAPLLLAHRRSIPAIVVACSSVLSRSLSPGV